MRTRPALIGPGCKWCDHDHDPAIECRYRPESSRHRPRAAAPKPRLKVVRITDASGKLIGVRHEGE